MQVIASKMSFQKEIPKDQKKGNDRLESINSSDATFPNNDSFGRNISNYNNIQNILNMYTKEIQREKNREQSANSFQRSENMLIGPEGNSDNIYINSLANLSSVIPSEHEENITIDNLQQISGSMFEEDSNIYANDSLNQQIQEKLNTLAREHEANFVNMNLENMEEIRRNDSQAVDSSVGPYQGEQEESQQYILYNRHGSEKDSNVYAIYPSHKHNMNYSKNRECEKEPSKQQKKYNSNVHRNIPCVLYPKDQSMYGNNMDDKVDYTFYNYERSFNEIPNGQTISREMNSEYSTDPFRETRKLISQDLAFSPHSDKCGNSNYESIDIYNIDRENDVQLDYSTVTCESSNINALDSNGIYRNVMQKGDSYVMKPKTKYQTLVEFMRNRSCDSSMLMKNNGTNTKKGRSANESFEIKAALTLKNRLEHDAKNEQKPKIAYSENNDINTRKKYSSHEKTKLKSYSLEDMKNGTVNIPSTIFVPLSFNVPGDNIIDSYERNKKLEKFMQDCNNSTNLILKYPQAEKKQPSKTLNMPVSMASIVNNNIGVPIIYDDDFDREHYHPNVTNLHVGSVFERHVFNILKNKKDLGKKIYSESDKFKKYNYDQEHGFWISNISKDRIVNPEKNNSYITELVYEKDKTYQNEMNMLKNCKNYKEVVPPIHEFYKNNNFYKFLLKEDLCPPHLNPDIATIMRRYDVDNISCHKIISEIPGITPYVKDVNE